MANLPKTQPLMMGTHLSLPALKTPLRTQWLIMCPGPPCSRCWSDSHRAAQEGVRKRMCRKTSAVMHFRAISFLSFPLWGCS